MAGSVWRQEWCLDHLGLSGLADDTAGLLSGHARNGENIFAPRSILSSFRRYIVPVKGYAMC